jgi:hypothetical protein
MPCPPGHRASSLGEPASSRSRIARGPFVRRGISQGAVRQARVVSQAAHSTENDDPDPAGHHEAEDSTRLGDGRDAALLSINVIDIGRVPYQVLLWAPTEVVSIRIAFRRGKTKLRAIKPTFCPHGEPSSSISKTSSTPKMVCMCSTGLAIVAEQETNRTRRFPTAAQIRLSLGSNKALVNSAAHRLYQTPQPWRTCASQKPRDNQTGRSRCATRRRRRSAVDGRSAATGLLAARW